MRVAMMSCPAGDGIAATLGASAAVFRLLLDGLDRRGKLQILQARQTRAVVIGGPGQSDAHAIKRYDRAILEAREQPPVRKLAA